jgi:hypothetical protein
MAHSKGLFENSCLSALTVVCARTDSDIAWAWEGVCCYYVIQHASRISVRLLVLVLVIGPKLKFCFRQGLDTLRTVATVSPRS